MEPINFYNNGSRTQHKAISRWFCMSSLALATLCISMAIVQWQQWHISSSLREEKDMITAELAKLAHVAAYKQNQMALHAKLERKNQQIQLHNKNQKNPIELLQAIKAALKADITLEALSYNEKSLELKIAGEKTKSLVQFAQALSQKDAYADLGITALECKDKNRIVATIKNN